MLVDLVQVTTADGFRLDGAYQAASPRGNAGPPPAWDACLLVHGTGGNFYSSTLLAHVAERLLELGISVVRVNTRGRDLVSTAATTGGSRRQGAAYEMLDQCRHDVAAWVEFLVDRGADRIGLVGHSSGAVKVLFAQAQAALPRVAGIAALSPPRLSHASFLAGQHRDRFLEEYRRAEQLVAAGQPDALLDVRFPLPYLITAGGYLEKYGPHERFNLLRFVGRLSLPVLATFGGEEVRHNAAFVGLPEDLLAAAGPPPLAVATIDGADHFYSGCWTELVGRLKLWLRAAESQGGPAVSGR